MWFVCVFSLFAPAGLSGDLLDLKVAMAACVIGYSIIGQKLLSHPDTVLGKCRIDVFLWKEETEKEEPSIFVSHSVLFHGKHHHLFV